jgi:hypothetical protein
MVAAKTAVAIGRRMVATAGIQVIRVQQHASLATTQMTAQLAMVVRLTTQIVLLMVTATHAHHSAVAAMTVMHVRHAVTMSVNLVLLETARTAQRVQVLVVASATATVQSALHTANRIHRVSKTALQSAVGQKTVAVILLAKSATQTVLTAQHAMIHANQVSVVHATQTQTRRLSSKTRFLSV